jgi:hypothetical protein
VSIRGTVWFAFGLSCLIGASLAVVYAVYWRLDAERVRATRSDFPVAEAARRRLQQNDPGKLLPPAPRLDGIVPVPPGQPAGRVLPGLAATLVEDDVKNVAGWQWADKDHTIARIPIGEAMSRLLAKPGDLVKARPGAKAMADASNPPSASNSGRGPGNGGEK